MMWKIFIMRRDSAGRAIGVAAIASIDLSQGELGER
jgi:hypothetical protein